jgi:hypothetical protein
MLALHASEEGWSSLVDGLPRWRPSRAPIPLVAPHSDDEILGVGGPLPH